MTELQKIKVSVSKSEKAIKEFEATHEGSLSSLIDALKNIKNSTNEYLTELVNTEKSLNTNQKKERKTKAASEKYIKMENEESDVEIEEDLIDAQIKQELSTRHSSRSDNPHRSEKRTRSQSKNKKRLKQ